MPRIKTQQGQATTELLVSALVLVPMFVFVPLVGKYVDIKQRNQEAARYAVWERTIWSDPSAMWNDGEATKNDATILVEQNTRVYGHPKQGIDDANLRENPLWKDGAGRALISSKATGSVVESTIPGMIDVGSVRILAYEGLPIPLLDEVNLGLSGRGYVTASTQVTANNAINSAAQLNYSSSASILSNAWSAPSEAILRGRVDRLVHNELVDAVALPADTLSAFPLFVEGRDARPVRAAVDSRALPTEFINSQ